MTITKTEKIKLSVVIAASSSQSLLEVCLKSLDKQRKSPDIEVIVVCNYDEGTKSLLDKEFPDVRKEMYPPSTTVPELRTQGISLSQGEIVALIEDNCVVDENWCEEVTKAHQLPYSVIGGSVENGSNLRPVDWAVYFYEYGKYMLPNEAGVIDSLSGNNVSYKKTLLDKIQSQYHNGFFETFIHQRLQQDGLQLYLTPEAIVYHTKRYEPGSVCKQCFYHGRLFAGRRIVDTPLIHRLILLIGSPVLPLVLPLRIVRRTYQKGKHIQELWFSLPYLLVFMSIWAFGEFCGYLCGEGGSSKHWT